MSPWVILSIDRVVSLVRSQVAASEAHDFTHEISNPTRQQGVRETRPVPLAKQQPLATHHHKAREPATSQWASELDAEEQGVNWLVD